VQNPSDEQEIWRSLCLYWLL